MGKTHRTKAPLYTQEPPGIQIVALYARVASCESTLPDAAGVSLVSTWSTWIA